MLLKHKNKQTLYDDTYMSFVFYLKFEEVKKYKAKNILLNSYINVLKKRKKVRPPNEAIHLIKLKIK